jgi:hypothetical protein
MDAIPKSELAQAFHIGVCGLGKYMRESAHPMLRGVFSPSVQEQCVHALFLRSLGWVTTLEVLKGPPHFQAIATSARALLEAAVDVVLLCKGPNGAPQEMLDWTISAKLKLCKEVINFYKAQGQALPDEHKPMLDFYTQQTPLIGALHSSHGWNRHPDRWTGRNLLDDCVVADGLAGPMIRAEMEMTLSEFYQTQIRRLNWQIHSSGLAGVYNISKEVIIAQCALLFKWSTDLATVTTQLALLNAGFAVSQEVTAHWEKLKASRLAAFHAALAMAQSNNNI